MGGLGVCSQDVSISYYRAKRVCKLQPRLTYRAPMAQRAIGQLNGLSASTSDANPGASNATRLHPMPPASSSCPDHLKRAVGVQWLTLCANDHSIRSHIGRNARQHSVQHIEDPELPKTHWRHPMPSIGLSPTSVELFFKIERSQNTSDSIRCVASSDALSIVRCQQ